jgi:hypothetical protein
MCGLLEDVVNVVNIASELTVSPSPLGNSSKVQTSADGISVSAE